MLWIRTTRSGGPDYGIQFLDGASRYAQRIVKPATERYKTTTVTERRSLYAEHEGIKYGTHNDKLLSSVTEILRLKEQWESAGKRTNQTEATIKMIPLNGTMIITNGLQIWHGYTNVIER